MPYRLAIRKFKKQTGFGPHLLREKVSRLRRGRSSEPAAGALTGGNVQSESRTFQRRIHQKADRFWSAPAGGKSKPVAASPLLKTSHTRFHRRQCPVGIVYLSRGDFIKKRTGFGPQ
jgi:hypothetical protein